MDLISGFILVLITVLTSIYAYFKYSYMYWKSKGVPCDEPTFPYGNARGLGATINAGHFIKNLYDKYKPTGAKLCGVYFFANPTAVLLDLDLVKSVLVKDFTSFDERGLYAPAAKHWINGSFISIKSLSSNRHLSKWRRRPAECSSFFIGWWKMAQATIENVTHFYVR